LKASLTAKRSHWCGLLTSERRTKELDKIMASSFGIGAVKQDRLCRNFLAGNAGCRRSRHARGVSDHVASHLEPELMLSSKRRSQDPVSTEAITPHAITVAGKKWFHQEFHFSNVMIHSKVVVFDPFGKNPVVMTGLHNLEPKESQSNDDNLVIIENTPGLAQEYAVNILGVIRPLPMALQRLEEG
jgi:phosphatidylserine/phosphatidylglycerophosphate/cardiolipin synthase-like enzyme